MQQLVTIVYTKRFVISSCPFRFYSTTASCCIVPDRKKILFRVVLCCHSQCHSDAKHHQVWHQNFFASVRHSRLLRQRVTRQTFYRDISSVACFITSASLIEVTSRPGGLFFPLTVFTYIFKTNFQMQIQSEQLGGVRLSIISRCSTSRQTRRIYDLQVVSRHIKIYLLSSSFESDCISNSTFLYALLLVWQTYFLSTDFVKTDLMWSPSYLSNES